MAALDAKWPVRADHRFILKLVKMVGGGKIVPHPGEFNRVSQVFVKAGGSWERVFNGSVVDINLLKKVIKVAAKNGYMTLKAEWK